jgi:hypothetical protein
MTRFATNYRGASEGVITASSLSYPAICPREDVESILVGGDFPVPGSTYCARSWLQGSTSNSKGRRLFCLTLKRRRSQTLPRGVYLVPTNGSENISGVHSVNTE